jgi:hypothetical protein
MWRGCWRTDIEAVAAAGPSLRVGFSLGELLDFLLGWLGADICGDDLHGQPVDDGLSSERKYDRLAREWARHWQDREWRSRHWAEYEALERSRQRPKISEPGQRP